MRARITTNTTLLLTPYNTYQCGNIQRYRRTTHHTTSQHKQVLTRSLRFQRKRSHWQRTPLDLIRGPTRRRHHHTTTTHLKLLPQQQTANTTYTQLTQETTHQKRRMCASLRKIQHKNRRHHQRTNTRATTTPLLQTRKLPTLPVQVL